MPENILNYTESELKNYFTKHNYPSYRASQVFNAIHKILIDSIAELKIIPKELRAELEHKFTINYPCLINKSESGKDGTIKFLFEYTSKNKNENSRIETVLISDGDRKTICLSAQAGCNAGCEFCATGRIKPARNLTAGEIAAQVYAVIKETSLMPTNIVYMGMGEPMLNYDNVIRSLLILTSESGAGLPSRKITVSTIGFEGRIKKFTDDITMAENKPIRNTKLALSLHSTDSGIREKLIPTSKIHNLSKVYEELIYFYRKTGTKVTYEYIHFPGINDTPNDVKRLAKLSRMIPCNINIIPFHPVSFILNKPLERYNINNSGVSGNGNHNSLSKNNLIDFIAILRQNKIIVNLRKSSGVDINAACGQLAASNKR